MINLKIKEIFDEFDHMNNFKSCQELTSGHINDTYYVKTDGSEAYILQRINHTVFKNVPGLVRNKVAVSQHLKNKLSNLSIDEINKKVVQFIKSKKTENYYYKDGDDYWNLMSYIKGSYTYEVVKDEQIAYEAGKLLGEFHSLTADFDSTQLIEVIPNFHDMEFRYKQYAYAVQSASIERLLKAEKLNVLVSEYKEEMHIIQNLRDSEKIPLRVTHNDTKISNTLFDKNNRGMCLIDLDTVMPGVVHYDFGDAIRTICNTATEDEKDLKKVEFNLEYYKAYLNGFLKSSKDSLSFLEIENLALSAKTMIFIIGLRFLTDYLLDDKYYKTKYEEHNLDRAKNQFKLIESFNEQLDKVKSLV